jgi:hypothetical protein
MSDVDIADVAAQARREAMDIVAEMAGALAVALDAFETLLATENEFGAPVEWPLHPNLVTERVQLAAFVDTMKALPDPVRDFVRAAYGPVLAEAKARSGYYTAHELSTSPVLPETKAAVEQLRLRLADVERAAVFDRELRDALRPLALGHRAL